MCMCVRECCGFGGGGTTVFKHFEKAAVPHQRSLSVDLFLSFSPSAAPRRSPESVHKPATVTL